MHHIRRQERHAQKLNVAADYAINNHLIENNFILPKGGLVDDQYIDMTTEEIYNKLPEPPEGDWQIILDNSGCGDVLDHPNKAQNTSAIEAEWTVAINQAYEAAKQQGKAPGGMESIIEDINTPKLDWRAILYRFLSANNKNDYSYTSADHPQFRIVPKGCSDGCIWTFYLENGSLHERMWCRTYYTSDCNGWLATAATAATVGYSGYSWLQQLCPAHAQSSACLSARIWPGFGRNEDLVLIVCIPNHTDTAVLIKRILS